MEEENRGILPVDPEDIENEISIEEDVIYDGSGGTSDYEKLKNKPQINSVELIGNKTTSELKLQPEGDYADTRITNSELEDIFADL